MAIVGTGEEAVTEEVTEATMTEETEVVTSDEMIEEMGIDVQDTAEAEVAHPKDRKEWREKLQEAEVERENETNS